jgi:hypothetical protein
MIRKRASAMAERAQAKQRAIQATQTRQALEARGETVPPIRLQEIQTALKDFGTEKPRLRLVERLDETA